MWLTRVLMVAWMVGTSLMPAAAQEPDTAESAELLDLYERALTALADEIGHVVALGRLQPPVPDGLQIVPELLRLTSIPQGQLQHELDLIDNTDGPVVLAELHGGGLHVAGSVEDVLSTNVPRWDLVDPALYVEAYDELLASWWLAGGSEIGLHATPIPTWEPAWTADTIDLWIALDPSSAGADSAVDPIDQSEVEGAAPPTALGQSRTTAAIFGAVAALVLASAGAWLVRKRPRAHKIDDTRLNDESYSHSPRPEEVLEAGRLFLNSSSIDEFGERVATHASRLCSATGAVFICEEGTWSVDDSPSLPQSLIDRALATGHTVESNGDVIVPVLSTGRVIGVIGVAKPANGAGPAQQLAPLAGEGLASIVHQQATEQLAFVDGLTSVNNRRRFDLDLAGRSQEAAAGETPLAVAMIDIDHFKTYNDSNGHQEGDEALRVVARLISESLRAEDTVYRYGGEEFAVLLPGADLQAAQAVVERFRRSIESHTFSGGSTQPGGCVTVSVGVAGAPTPDGRLMLEGADAALFRAKKQGRNRVVVATSPTK